jgi:hypothetical protein
MSDRDLRYWLQWPHTKRDHTIAFVFFFAVTLAGGATEQVGVAVVAALMTVLLGVRLMAWNAADPEARADDKDLLGGSDEDEEYEYGDDGRGRDGAHETGRDRT